jgi:hypothetical protein
MYSLFRFTALRAPEAIESSRTIVLQPSEALHRNLLAARAAAEPAANLKKVAEHFVSSPAFIGDPAALRFFGPLSALKDSLGEQPDGSSLATEVAQAFDQAPDKVIADTRFRADKVQLHDSLIALKLLSESPVDVASLILFARIVDLVERVAIDDPTLYDADAVAQIFSRPLVLPADLVPLPQSLERQHQSDTDSAQQAEQDRALLERSDALEDAAHRLATLDGSQFEASSPASPSIALVAVASVTQVDDKPGHDGAAFAAASQVHSGLFVAPQRLTTTAVAALPTATRSVLSQVGVDLRSTTVPQAVVRIWAELSRIAPQVLEARSRMRIKAPPTVLRVGLDFFESADLDGIIGRPGKRFGIVDAALPATHGTIRPVGVADLLVVKYHVARYELGEIAYIENVLKGEVFKRGVSRTETIDETTVLETETTKEEERDLQSTERFELSQETQNTLQMDGKLQPGSTASPAYGPALQFQSNNQNPVAGSQTQSQRQASSFARDVTSRSASRVSERIRSQVTRTVKREMEEKTEHNFQNGDGAADHVVGVYQWVEKVHSAQVFNYGRRLFYDIVVPEPAAFRLKAMGSSTPAGQTITKPIPFTFDVSQVHDWNYAAWAQLYGATNIEPPPPLYKTVSKTFTETGPEVIAKSQEITFPGYQATGYKFNLKSFKSRAQTLPEFLVSSIGAADLILSQPLNGETDSIMIGMSGVNVTHIMLALDVFCERTPSSYQRWQAKAHAAIVEAYRKQQAAYEERLANARSALRIQLMGNPPAQNRLVERTELKRCCISLVTHQHYDSFRAVEFGGIDPDTGTNLELPQVQLGVAEAQGRYVRFFEQAFEWDQIVYQFYPYFWSRREHWVTKVNLRDPDPDFTAFLSAGSARVLIPVRPGFETALAHFMETGAIPEDGELGDLHSDLYLPLIQEIVGHDAAEDGVPYGEPWEVRLPTTLVKVRADGSLPKWKPSKDAKGAIDWVPDEG